MDKRAYHAFFSNETADNWRNYRKAKRSANKAVSVAKSTHHDDIEKKLDASDGERSLNRLKRQAENITKFHGLNDEHSSIWMDHRQMLDRWRD